jgi:hypothetical protein
LTPVSTTPAVPAAKFAAWWQIVVDTGRCILTCEYLREFLKKTLNEPNVFFRGLRDDDS